MKTPKLLIVDDEPYLVRLYKEMLQQNWLECQIFTSFSGQEALAIIKYHEIDVLLTDIRMPNINGLSLMKESKQLQPDMQMLVLTALGEAESAVEALRLGAVNYLVKPVSSEVLNIAVTNAWEKRKAIIAHRQTVEALSESEAGYRAMFEHMNDGVAVYEAVNNGEDFIFVDFNRAAESIDQITKKEVICKRLTELFPGTRKMGLLEIMNRVWQTGKAEYLIATHYEDHRISGWRDNYVYKLPNGKIVSIFRDQTERIQAQKANEQLYTQLRQAQKLESIGALAGGIAHDFNNILFPIIGFTEMTIEELPEDSLLRDNLNSVLKASYRARDLIQQILNFSRQAEVEYLPLHIHHIIREAVQLLSAALPKTINIKTSIAKCRPTVANADQIHQIVMNLCTNAYHAMAESGGTLTVTLKEVSVKQPDKITYSNLLPGDYLKLTVEDTGQGMDAETMERIFDPYFTTKDKGKGSGLGLSVVHGIVKSINGHIAVRSAVRQGSSFEVLFPVFTDNFIESLEHKEKFKGGGNEKILVVDDEVLITKMLFNMLSSSGYKVVACSSSYEAFNLFQHQPDAFDMVITDTTMPNMTGIELAVKMLGIRPDIPIIICTGFSELISHERARELGIRHLIYKPIIKSEINRIIREVLDYDKPSSQ